MSHGRSALTAVLLFAALLAGAALAQEAAPAKAPPLSPARRAGNPLFVSGQLPRTPDGKEVRESLAAETRQVMDNLERILKENGYTLDDVVSATVYLKDIGDYQEMNKVYGSYFKQALPARACVGGVEIVAGFRVEISCIAYKE
jgi:2-iminobutanoate/2-iminopropanoate deaminase